MLTSACFLLKPLFTGWFFYVHMTNIIIFILYYFLYLFNN